MFYQLISKTTDKIHHKIFLSLTQANMKTIINLAKFGKWKWEDFYWVRLNVGGLVDRCVWKGAPEGEGVWFKCKTTGHAGFFNFPIKLFNTLMRLRSPIQNKPQTLRTTKKHESKEPISKSDTLYLGTVRGESTKTWLLSEIECSSKRDTEITFRNSTRKSPAKQAKN